MTSNRKKKRKKKAFPPEPGSSFESKPKTCYSIKIFKGPGTVQVCENKHVTASLKLSSFPDKLDLNSVEVIAGLIRVVRENGVQGLIELHNLEYKKARPS